MVNVVNNTRFYLIFFKNLLPFYLRIYLFLDFSIYFLMGNVVNNTRFYLIFKKNLLPFYFYIFLDFSIKLNHRVFVNLTKVQVSRSIPILHMSIPSTGNNDRRMQFIAFN